MPSDEFRNLVALSTSFSAILRAFDLRTEGGNIATVRRRIEEEKIDAQHIKTGRGSNGGRKFSPKFRPYEEMFVENSTNRRHTVKKRIREEALIPYICQMCGQGPEWNGKELVLVLDHTNGVYNDDRLENLRFLCPNCNSQTPTFAGRNSRIVRTS